MTIKEFISIHEITLRSYRIPFRLDLDDAEWARTAKHYACELSRRGSDKTVRVFYSQGTGIKSGPRVTDVLDSLKSDASTARDDFDTWADDIDADRDSRKAYATYEACIKIRRDLRAFLGRDYAELEQTESQ